MAAVTIQYRRATAAQWFAANPVLAAAEPAFETDSKKWKLGDGATAWNSLPYLPDMAWLVGNYLNVTARGAQNGVASLDGTTKIPAAQLPDLSGTYLTAAQKAAANGVASLDANTRVPAAQMPTDFALHVPRWATGAVYTVGQQIVSPNNDVVSVVTAHTAGASFDPTKFSLGASAGAKGRVWINRVLTNSGSIVGSTVVSNLATFTFKGGRKYRIEWDTDWLPSTGNVVAAFSIGTCSVGDAAASTAVTLLAIRDFPGLVGSISAFAKVTAYYEPATDQTVQVKFLAQTDGTGGSLIVQGNRAGGSVYAIIDEGAQY